MFSGTKSTDLINTILNLAYFRVAERYVATTFDQHAEDLYHVHQGDDVWLSNTNAVWARLVYYTLNSMGFLFQDSKQMFGVARGEYLRVMYQGGQAVGYLARSIINYVLRPLQNDVDPGASAWASNITTSIATMTRRGLAEHMAQVLWVDGCSFWCKVRAHSSDLKPVSLPLVSLVLPSTLGGLGCPPPFKYCSSRDVELPPLPQLDLTLDTTAHALPTRMTDDWIEHVSAKVARKAEPSVINTPALKRAVLRDNYSDIAHKTMPRARWNDFKGKMQRCAARTAQVAKNAEIITMDAHSEKELMTALVDQVGATQPSQSPALTSNLKSSALAPHDSQQVKSFCKLGDSLEKFIAKSRFKSSTFAALAYGVSELDAIRIMMQAEDDMGSNHTELQRTLFSLIRNKNHAVTKLLLEGDRNCITALHNCIDINLCQYLASSATQVAVLSNAQHANLHAITLHARVESASVQCLSALACMGKFTSSVSY